MPPDLIAFPPPKPRYAEGHRTVDLVRAELMALHPDFRRAWLRILEARGVICEISAERLIREMGLR